MKIIRNIRIVFAILMFAFGINGFAQTNGDKLFLEGQKLQQTQTLVAQNQAIKKFQAAKIIYTAAEKKTMCDNQIAICYNNIKAINQRAKAARAANVAKRNDKNKKEEDTKAQEAEKAVAKVTPKDVTLTLSKSRLDFKYNPKEGQTQSVSVKCNYKDWEISSKPDWVTVYLAENKFSVEVKANMTDGARSGVIKVKCHDKEVDLVVNQKKASSLQKKLDKIKDIIKE